MTTPRLSPIYRTAALMVRYAPEHDTAAGNWRVWDSERSERLAAEYADEASALAGARLAAAIDIDELYRGSGK